MNYSDVLHFWFVELQPKDWFTKNADVDARMRERFFDLHQEIVHGEHQDWKTTAEGVLAYVIVLDQFSRNLFRGNAKSFQNDEQALAAAKYAIAIGLDTELPPKQRPFLYMPYMHSESRDVHEKALALFHALGNDQNLQYEILHKKIIDRFGRYPHRNTILGRETTEAEQEFLDAEEHASF
ncbi:MAG: hypothetical protein ACI9VM_000752 [Candidatus Azotimanducaceae bacterium]|jgi:uncharacterized protein (DUF924 family)